MAIFAHRFSIRVILERLANCNSQIAGPQRLFRDLEVDHSGALYNTKSSLEQSMWYSVSHSRLVVPALLLAVLVPLVTLLCFYSKLTIDLQGSEGFSPAGPFTSQVAMHSKQKLTIRVNTFRRLDLLETFLDYYVKTSSDTSCRVVEQIQVVWSDPANDAPKHWLKRYLKDRVVFETHSKDSLNNRFTPLVPINTEAVLSVDDDLILPCDTLRKNLQVWSSFDKSLVGFTPRMQTVDTTTGSLKYLRWQHTWWSGIYSIMLTKVAIMHRDYLKAWTAATPEAVPVSFLEYIDKNRNCEDIAMAHLVARETNAAPVWTSGEVYEIGTQGISSGGGHFQKRGKCLEVLKDMSKSYPWVTGYQKVVPMSWL